MKERTQAYRRNEDRKVKAKVKRRIKFKRSAVNIHEDISKEEVGKAANKCKHHDKEPNDKHLKQAQEFFMSLMEDHNLESHLRKLEFLEAVNDAQDQVLAAMANYDATIRKLRETYPKEYAECPGTTMLTKEALDAIGSSNM